MKREKGLSEIEKTRIIAILRGVEREHLAPVADALYEGGVTVMEVTLNTSGALSMIAGLQESHGEKLYIGAGTVLDVHQAEEAIAAGASYLVTPNMEEEVIRYAVERGVPIFPGAFTPTEIVKAWKAGATAVKLFPSSSIGLPYIKEVTAPLNHIPLIAVGGITEDNLRQYLHAGCYALGIGGSLINLKEIRQGNYGWVKEKASRLSALSTGQV